MAGSTLELERNATEFSSGSDSKLVYFVVIPLILLSAIVVILDRDPSTGSPRPSLNSQLSPVKNVEQPSTVAPPPPDDRFPKQVQNNEEKVKGARFSKSYSKLEVVEASLAQARATIQKCRLNNETSFDPDYVPIGSVYRNPHMFHRSYLEMEKRFKIYVYENGDPPLYHYSTSLGILGIEGILIHHIEISKFRTRDPAKAHVYFLPLSVQSIVGYAYERGNRAWDPLQNIARDYTKLISQKHPYWNRTKGRDHFILACHDWAGTITVAVPYLWKNAIRVLCNANTSEGFKLSVDVSMPEIYLPDGTMDGLIGGPPPSERPILVFYAGGVHGYIRELLMKHWKGKDPDVHVTDYLPRHVSYYGMVRKSKYCISPSGYEVADARMVEALYMGCVPVLLKDGYAKPFDDVLDWSTFAVEIHSNQIPDLKKILMKISYEQYLEMQKAGVQVRRHFEVHFPPKRYDVFHMILHSIWLRRINIKLHETNES